MEFQKLFPQEMQQAKKIQNEKANGFRSRATNALEVVEKIIDVEKTVDGDYYRLSVYNNGLVTQTGIDGGEVEEVTNINARGTGFTGGTHSSGTGYASAKNVIAYTNMYNNSVLNTANGHTVKIKISYTLVNGGYDYISDYSLNQVFASKNIYLKGSRMKENSSGTAYVSYRYNGRVSGIYDGTPEVYVPCEFFVQVGNNQAKAYCDLK